MEQLLGRQPKLSNKDSIHSLFVFLFFLVTLFVYVFFTAVMKIPAVFLLYLLVF